VGTGSANSPSLPLPVTQHGRHGPPAQTPLVLNLVTFLVVFIIILLAVAYFLYLKFPNDIQHVVGKLYRYFLQDSTLRRAEL